LQRALHVVLPTESREIVSETHGVSVRPSFFDDIGEEESLLGVLWTLDEVCKQNLGFRTWKEEAEPKIAPLSSLLFFASEPNGDPVGFVVTEGKVVKPEIIVMSHEDYEDRRVRCGSLRDCLTALLEACR